MGTIGIGRVSGPMPTMPSPLVPSAEVQRN